MTERYVVTTNYWGHIFDEAQGEILTRWVFDVEEMELVGALVADKGSLNLEKWHDATNYEFDDLTDHIMNANPDALDNPADWGCEFASEVPDWCPDQRRANAPSI